MFAVVSVLKVDVALTRNGAVIVLEAVEIKPLRNPSVEVVELPHEFTVKGKSALPPPPPPLVRHTPAIEKQPEARFIPPVEENEVVAVVKLTPLVLPIENSELGLEVPIPTLPL
jgi:hypothetical protein